jgi:hypothetical protein
MAAIDVYVAAIPTRIIEWSSRRSRALAATDQLPRW